MNCLLPQWCKSFQNLINYLIIDLLAIKGMSAYIFFSGEILYTSTTDHEGVGLCAQESHPALSMRHACPSSDSNNYYYYILQPPTTPPPSPFYSRAEATTTSPHQTKRGPTSPCCPPQAPLLLQIVNNKTHYIQPCYYCGPRQLVFLLLVFTRFQHSTFDSGLGPDFWGQ